MKEPQAQHTPGPWEATTAKSMIYGINLFVHGPKGSPANAVICELGPTEQTHDTVRQAANARLIAAAPDMLAALKRAEPWLGRLIADGGHKDCCAPNDAIATLQRVSAAIAKAEHSQ